MPFWAAENRGSSKFKNAKNRFLFVVFYQSKTKDQNERKKSIISMENLRRKTVQILVFWEKTHYNVGDVLCHRDISTKVVFGTPGISSLAGMQTTMETPPFFVLRAGGLWTF